MKLLQIAQHVTDLGRATVFYSALLDAKPRAEYSPPGLVFFDLDGTRLLLDEGAPPALIYLQVPDVRALVAQFAAEGIEVTSAPRVIFSHDDDALGPAGTDEWMAFIKDSEGNTVGLASQLPREPASKDAGL